MAKKSKKEFLVNSEVIVQMRILVNGEKLTQTNIDLSLYEYEFSTDSAIEWLGSQERNSIPDELSDQYQRYLEEEEVYHG